MLRKNYQEKYIIPKKNNIVDISKEVQEVSLLFQELFQEVKTQDQEIKTISEELEHTNNIVKQTEQEVDSTNNQNKTYYILTGSIIGGGLGSLLLLYNPYIAIGTCIGGVISGGILGKFFK